jgi:hypothetical protein
MYTIWKRTVPPPSLTIFDAPDREKCVARRAVTNTPLQALVLLNDPTYIEAARALAERALRQRDDSPSQKIDYMFRLATARTPAAAERAVLLDSLEQFRSQYQGDGNDAVKLLSVGESKAVAAMNPRELAAWTTVASMILNLDETITRE